MSPLLCTQGLGDRTMHRACAVATPGRGKTRGVVPVPSKYEISLTSRKCSPVVFAIKDTHCPKFPERKMLSLPFLFQSCLLVVCCLSGPEQGFPTLALLAPGLNDSSQVWAGLRI